jgi:hypothetical protein
MTTRSDDQEVCPGGRLGENFRWMPLRHLTGDPRPGLGWPPHRISMCTPGVVPKRLRVPSLAGGVPYDGKCHAMTTWTCRDRNRASSGAHSRAATDESDPSTLTTIRKNRFCHHHSSLYGNRVFAARRAKPPVPCQPEGAGIPRVPSAGSPTRAPGFSPTSFLEEPSSTVMAPQLRSGSDTACEDQVPVHERQALAF